MTMRVDRFVDTNVFLAATAPGRPQHHAALALLEAGFADRTLFLSGQVVREYLAVATRPSSQNGLGLAQRDALGNARQFLARANYLPEDEAVRDTLLRLLESVPCTGKQLHDANIAATMVAHRVRHLVTLNPGDFSRFAEWLEIAGT